MSAYYNENDPKAAAWLRELIAAGLIAAGDVDERSIMEVRASDLTGYRQCHFFAGIGGWSYALRLARWPDSRPVWTGSCPCQPFSDAGKGLAEKDERHLWPIFRELIREGQPPVCFGEQVASAKGREWLVGVFADLEAMDYRRAGADLCAAGVKAPHRRQRLFWVAYAECYGGRTDKPERGEEGRVADGWSRRLESSNRRRCEQRESERESVRFAGPGSETDGLAESDGGQSGDRELQRGGEQRQQPQDGGIVRLGHARCERDERRRGLGDLGRSPEDQQGEARQREWRGDAATDSGSDGRMGDPESGGCGELRNASLYRPSRHVERADWSRFDIIACRDNKARRVEAGTFPLDHGLPGRVGLLRGYGNAIVPQVAAEFIEACEEAVSLTLRGA